MRDVVITGVGLISASGEGLEAHLGALEKGTVPPIDAESFPPYPLHPICELDLDRQIPKKSDQRQMEKWQRLGCYASGLALDSAGIKDNADLKARMHMIVAAGGGERDYAVDGQILTGLRTAANSGVFLNERLMSDIRPTLFLAQLSNLLAGNISIVHGVTGASRTFMGEEASGVDAIRTAQARIAHEQADIILVGASYNAERADVVLIHELGGFLWNKPYRPAFERSSDGGGFVLGSAACFFVMEAAAHAKARGAKALANITAVASDRCRRAPGDVANQVRRQWDEVGAKNPGIVLSGATGVVGITDEEREALEAVAPKAKIYATGDVIGHALEVQAPAGVAMGAALLASGKTDEAIITSVGHCRGEGMIRLTRAS